MKKLKLLMATLALVLGWSNAWAQETPTNGSAYYIYNETNGLFFTRGAAYGTQAYASPFGIPWRVEISDGKYTLKMNDIYLQNTVADGQFGYNGSYTDNDTPIALTPSGNASDGYTLKNGDNYITCPSSKGVVSMTPTASTWKFLTQAQYDAVLAARASTQETAVAASKGISIPGGSTLAEVVSDASAWTSTTTNDGVPTKEKWPITGNGRNGAYNEGTYGVELFQANDAYISKTISGLVQGIYKVTVRGMKRMGTNEGNVALESAGFYVSDAYMEANGNIIPLKSWASDNTTDAVPNGPAEVATIIGKGGYTNEGFVYVGADGNLSLSIHTDAFWWGGWMVFNGISYTYYNNEVTNEDAEALLATVPTAPMLKATKDALDLAQSNFESSRTISNYNALSTAIDNANASISVYAPLGTKLTEAATVKSSVSSNSPSYVTTFDSNIGTINTNYTGGLIAESDITTQIAAVETEILKLVKSQTVSGSDMTRALPNAACTGDVGDDNWKIKNALASGEFFRLDTWAGTASGMSVPMIEYWITNGNTLSSNEIYQTISGLQEGVYTVTATTAVNNESKVAPTAGSALLFANDKTTDITTGGTETSFKGQTGTFSVNVLLTKSDNGELKLGLKTVSPNYNWIAFKNVTLTYYGAKATSDDYAALNAAISAKDVNTLGFETGEYAPYNNVAVLTALKNAKAINQDADNAHSVVNAATAALEAANWSDANASNVECVYNGDFSQGDWGLTGWTRTKSWGKNLPSDEPVTAEILIAAGATTGHAYYNQPGSLQYGNAGVYTMPLKANTIYNLTFKYASWKADSNDGMTVSVLNNEDGMAAMVFPENNTLYSESGAFVTKTLVFVTGAAGDYVLTLANNGNTVMTDVSITKAANQYLEFADGSVPTYAPGTYPSVKITRTLTANRWATAIYPFAVSGVNYLAVFDRYNDATEVMGFSSAAASTANKPFLMKSIEGTSEITLSNVAVEAINATDVTYGNASLKGVYATTTVKESDNAYVISENEIRPASETGATVNPYRAYIQVTGTGARGLSFVIDDEETTAIDGIETVKNGNMKVYNLNGQRVEKPGKGLYIVNGKKLLVK